MKILFISHNPHEIHLEFAKSVGARVKITGLDKWVRLSKKISLIGYFFPIISFFYSLFIGVKENIILVDGGSSLYLSSFLKKKKPNLKIIYLDGDMIFYYLNKQIKLGNFAKYVFFFEQIDAIISVSKESNNLIPNFLKIPKKIVSPYSKQIKNLNIERKNYGLYVGRLDPDKNIKRIIEFGLQCPFFDKFIVIGAGTYGSYIKKIAKKNNKIIYIGIRKDVEFFYSLCKFLIHIPDYDPHPCTTIEAALCGCFPIISKNVGTNYLFDKLFFINNPDNFEEINNKIEKILDNEKKAHKLLKKSIKNFPTKEKSIKNFKNVFNEMLKEIK